MQLHIPSEMCDSPHKANSLLDIMPTFYLLSLFYDLGNKLY